MPATTVFLYYDKYQISKFIMEIGIRIASPEVIPGLTNSMKQNIL
jgi:hypothetical protein